MSETRDQIDSWNYIRGIAAILIMGLHYWIMFARLHISNTEEIIYRSVFGGAGGFVEVFTILAGFFTLQSIDNITKLDRLTLLESIRWFIRRIFRVYVLYFVVCCYQIFVLKDNEYAVSKFLMLRDFPPTWPLRYFLMFYLEAMLSIWIFPKKYRLLGFGMIYLFCSCVLCFAVTEIHFEVYNFGHIFFTGLFNKIFKAIPQIHLIVSIIIHDYMKVFLWSFVLYVIYKQGKDFFIVNPKIAKAIFFVAVMVCIFISPNPIMMGGYNSVFQWGGIAFILLLASLFLEYSVPSIKNNKVLNYLGDISFPVYLIHVQVMWTFNFNPTYYQYGSKLMLLCAIITLLLSSVYLVFERKYIEPLKKKIDGLFQ